MASAVAQSSLGPVLSNAKCEKMTRTLLLDHPFRVHPHDYDARYMDDSDAYRAAMRQKLYGPRKPHQTMLNNSSSCHESNDFHANYADEVPPKWQSTTNAEYVTKGISTAENNAKNREYSSFTRNSHFSLEGHEEPPQPMSLTKKDYSGKDPSMVSRDDYKQYLHQHNQYPPIFRDENEMQIRRGRDPEQKPHAVPVSRFERKPMIQSDPASKSLTHFSLGNDAQTWESVTQSAMRHHPLLPKPPPSEYERLEKKRSTVLDNPDLELEPMQSMQRLDYSLDPNLDRSTLTVDNTLSIKDLKSTHFTLGTDASKRQMSQYQATFGASRPPSISGEPLRRDPRLPVLAQPASKLAIIVEDFEDRRMGSSSQRQDYRDPMTAHDTRDLVEHRESSRAIKNINSQSSIRFGLDSQGLGNTSRSVTQNDFALPETKDNSNAAAEAYQRGGRTLRLGVQAKNIFNATADPMENVSVAHMDYKPPDMSKVPADPPNHEDHRIYLKSSHFEIGTDKDDPSIGLDRQLSTTRRHYPDPASLAHTVRAEGAGAVGPEGRQMISRRHDCFDETIRNTITRYPNKPDTFVTVNRSTYKAVALPKDDPHRHQPHTQDMISAYLHPMVVPVPATTDPKSAGMGTATVYQPIRDFSTVSRRTYIAPEMTKYVVPGANGRGSGI
ncbi:hypothetical protein BC831DRAFT_452397 [Entophlyctis helioformis]|nr:hypothetical protein BC831DRAFT_452397 [Entophlyctis helioformis]